MADRIDLLADIPPAGGEAGHRGVLPVLLMAAALSSLLVACVSDRQLLQDNRAVALKTAQKQAAGDLACPQAAANVVSQQEVAGTAYGPLWSLYSIQAKGCGKTVRYSVECTDDAICSVKR